MAELAEYSFTLKFAGDLSKGYQMYTCEIPAFGSGAIVHGATRDQAAMNSELALNCLQVAYAAQVMTMPPADMGA